MNKRLSAALLALLLLCPSASAELADGSYQDLGEGYRGRIVATVTIRGGKVESVAAESRADTPDEYLQKALDELAPAIVAANGVDGVDTVAGATGSSKGILEAVGNVLTQANASGAGGGASADAGASGGAGASTLAPEATIDPAKADGLLGLGSAANFRVGPGKDDTDTPVYSFNVAMAAVVFDKDGRIMEAEVDVYEVSTPNYDGATMPHFSGWPNTEGYNVYDQQQGKVTGKSENTEQSAADELAAWKTKRDRGDSYGMNPKNDWYRQMDAYEAWMRGKTADELRDWFARYTSERNGRPIKADSDNEDDKKALAGMTDSARAELADVVSMATMSLSDGHGLLLEAIEKAWSNAKPYGGG